VSIDFLDIWTGLFDHYYEMSMKISDSDKLREIITIDSELNKIQDQDILLERILSVARKITNADAGSIYVMQGDVLYVKYAQNNSMQKKLPPGQKLPYKFFTVPVNTHSISGYAAKKKRTVNIPDYYAIPKDAPYSHNTKYDKDAGYISKSMLALPLLDGRGTCLGVLQIINKMDEAGEYIPFTKEDEQLVEHFANNVVIALEKAQLTRSNIELMARMSRARDPKETSYHVNRVAGFSVEIYDRWAFKAGIPEHKRDKDRDVFRMAAMLHDVGKVGISDRILKKPGKLNDEEYHIMKMHTLIGANFFEDPRSEFDIMAKVVVLNHHERWDGTGYPGNADLDDPEIIEAQERFEKTGTVHHVDPKTGEIVRKIDLTPLPGKKGKDIPIFGRIVAIADVYVALRSARVYKDAWTEEDVLNELRACSGTQFDPELIEIFFEVYDRLQTIAEQFADQ
jgi:HD-GYP domain-containing protein (c-di-GMP phosphodiesterase class II)